MNKIYTFLILLLLLINALACSRAHGTGDHCDHSYRTCLRFCKGDWRRIAICEGVCLTSCLGCKGLSR